MGESLEGGENLGSRTKGFLCFCFVLLLLCGSMKDKKMKFSLWAF